MKKILRHRLYYFSAVVFISIFFLNLNTFSVEAAPVLKLNSRGHDVVVLQQSLMRLNYTISTVSGTYDKQTQDAVKAFQQKNKLKVTGIVDRETWWAIKGGKPDIKQQKPVSSSSGTSSKSNTSAKPNVSSDKIWGSASSVPYGQTFLEPKEVSSIIATAKNYLGFSYTFGGDTPEEGFDCSGYLEYVFAKNGIAIPRTADEQYKLGKTVKRSQLSRGDLVFFTTYEPGASHCGIYLGDNSFIHASNSGVRIDDMDNSYWASRYYGSKHIVK